MEGEGMPRWTRVDLTLRQAELRMGPMGLLGIGVKKKTLRSGVRTHASERTSLGFQVTEALQGEALLSHGGSVRGGTGGDLVRPGTRDARSPGRPKGGGGGGGVGVGVGARLGSLLLSLLQTPLALRRTVGSSTRPSTPRWPCSDISP